MPSPGSSSASRIVSRSRPSVEMASRDLVPELQVEDVVREMRAEQEFGRQVRDRLRAPVLVELARGHQARQHTVANGEGERGVMVERRGLLEGPAGDVEQVVDERPPDRVNGAGDARV